MLSRPPLLPGCAPGCPSSVGPVDAAACVSTCVSTCVLVVKIVVAPLCRLPAPCLSEPSYLRPLTFVLLPSCVLSGMCLSWCDSGRVAGTRMTSWCFRCMVLSFWPCSPAGCSCLRCLLRPDVVGHGGYSRIFHAETTDPSLAVGYNYVL